MSSRGRDTTSETVSTARAASDRAHRAASARAAPRLRVLYHADLERLGATSVPGAVSGEWTVIGRAEPGFFGAGTRAAPRGIDDRCVSRQQARIRFREDLGRFEVAAVPGAKQPLAVLDLATGARAAIESTALLEPGGCVAIGERVLLGLEVARFREPRADRFGLVGEGAALWAVRDDIASLAPFGTVLVTGETGTGKELVARALHAASPRGGGPFVAVNCAALPASLVESALFGHRRGAFTGADAESRGLFAAASGGTLFLDEIGELPLAVQPKLLRAIELREVHPVGATSAAKVDVRLVAATHKDLAAEVEAGAFRADLYHRVAVHLVCLPPLRARAFDVPELLAELLRRHAEEHLELARLWAPGDAWEPSLPFGFVVDLLRADWRGNVRELQNVAARLARASLSRGEFVAPHLPVRAPRPSASSTAAVRPSANALLDRRALNAAARSLGIAARTIEKLLRPAALTALCAAPSPEAAGAIVAQALGERLDEEGSLRALARGLGVSRTTLARILDRAG